VYSGSPVSTIPITLHTHLHLDITYQKDKRVKPGNLRQSNVFSDYRGSTGQRSTWHFVAGIQNFNGGVKRTGSVNLTPTVQYLMLMFYSESCIVRLGHRDQNYS
jgi:hypothetical protein